MLNPIRQFSLFDRVIIGIDQALHTLCITPRSLTRKNPADDIAMSTLNRQQSKLSGCLMRVNHAGEVCAQALYQAQALASKNPLIKQKLAQAAREEVDHLAWCESRIAELDSHVSYLNPIWYFGSFMFGSVAGFLGDAINLGFLQETEQQVTAHLESHLAKIAAEDLKSRAIITQMRNDEMQHATTALNAGAAQFPAFVGCFMRATAKIMTTAAYWL